MPLFNNGVVVSAAVDIEERWSVFVCYTGRDEMEHRAGDICPWAGVKSSASTTTV